ncbi:alpha/beta fold hydrolase [Aeromicrobium fastidiosum]|uniref:Alpha/beta hydrolase n=1 Tax=Aeromicrobium fastidiosum TaxID=52699 RepID=A0A641ARV0_9ACTN|nr:alpha/beta fold hydrolase [Aeromicrobium fastidiosum]KAA1379943.1 alpha/beta hydrolase [Aeromicrobium fastidiosum]MBP2389452.1 pimeloyl-ACP methyl ester carboxylesterase [Aeromicrobium fastidiosum]
MQDAQQVTVNGRTVDFAALSWGPDDAPLALLLHGYPDSPHSWRGVAESLVEAGYRVVAPWTRGYAPSSVPTDGSFHIGALASDALELHGLLGGDARAVLIGHDWGAVAAHAVAGLDGQPFRRIVTMAVPPAAAFLDRADGMRAWLARLARQARLSWYVAFQQLPVVSERSLGALVPRLWSTWSPGHPAGAELEAAWEAIGDRRTEVLRYYRHAARWWTVPAQYRSAQRGLMRASTVPMLYLHGRQDGCVLRDWTGPTRDVLPPGSRVEVVSGAGHFLQVEQPDVVARLVVDFVVAG